MWAMNNVPHVDLEIGLESDEQLRTGGLVVLASVRPNWTPDKIKWKTFTDGITNKLIGAWLGDEKSDTVLIRVYGEGTEKIIDRKAEVDNMQRLQRIGCGSRLYASFNNGLCYEFIPGEILSQDMLKDPLIFKDVARMMAKIHSVPLNDTEVKPGLWDRLAKFIKLSNPSCNPRLVEEFPSKEQLETEMKHLKEILVTCSSPVVFCHNDALLGNIVVDKNENKVSFIDMEYGCANYAAYDIANHFAEFVGCDGQLDYLRWFPDRQYRREWIKEYMTASGSEVEEELFENNLDLVDKFVLASHLLWGVWAVIQAENSTIDFDFVDYAIQKLNEYWRWKSLLGIQTEN